MNIKNIEDIRNRISSNHKAPVYKKARSLLTTEQSDLLNNALSIIKKYSTENWYELEFSAIQTDVLMLQSILVQLAAEFGDVMSNNETESNTLSTARAKIRLDIKKVKKDIEVEGAVVKMTVDDAKDLSYVMTEDMSDAYTDSRALGGYLKFVYFAMKDQVQLLEKALHRFANKTGE